MIKTDNLANGVVKLSNLIWKINGEIITATEGQWSINNYLNPHGRAMDGPAMTSDGQRMCSWRMHRIGETYMDDARWEFS